ncbi:MAG: thrombospondin type 3 repeat-containing protein, partial [Deltaproteobacteria bacterium]|nr:thrombospondin type 3 repeat-containing protein [Deltaproteobacteria bacterium]
MLFFKLGFLVIQTVRIFTFLLSVLWIGQANAVEFTGNVSDFPPETCLEAPNGQNIAFPASFPAGSISGFDVRQICLLYNRPDDRLDVGVATFDDAFGVPVFFGDADGDGDPGSAGPELVTQAGLDLPDLSGGEYFSFILDFDGDPLTTPDAVAGVSAERRAPEGFRVSEVDTPDPGISFSYTSDYYGLLLSTAGSSFIHATPSAEAPHLEFSVGEVTGIPNFDGLELEVADAVLIYFRAGSLSDSVIGEDAFQLQGVVWGDHVDTDGDGIPDATDADADGDGVTDGDEVERGTDPLDPDDPAIRPDAASPEDPSSPGSRFVQGGGCSLSPQAGSGAAMLWLLPLLLLPLFFSLRFSLPIPPPFGKGGLGGFVNVFISLSLLFFSPSALALNTEQFRPRFDGLGLINLLTSEPLEKGGWSAGFGFGYSHNPLKQQISGLTTSDLADYHVNGTVTGAYGLSKFASAGITVPF